jgi:hypothetical protein
MRCPNAACDSAGWEPVRLEHPGIVMREYHGTTVIVTHRESWECACCKTRWRTEHVDVCRDVTIPDPQAATG